MEVTRISVSPPLVFYLVKSYCFHGLPRLEKIWKISAYRTIGHYSKYFPGE